MPNYIQYSTSNPSGSLKKGNAALGITNEVTGPTSTTGWYSGINPQSGSYVVYEVAASGDPDIYCPQNTTELLNLVKSKGATGGNTGSVAAALAWIATQNNLLAVNEIYPNIVTSGSVLMLDAGFVGSYPTTASTWYDVSGNNNSGSLINGPMFNTGSGGSIVFDGVNDYVNITNNSSINPSTAITVASWCNIASYGANYAPIVFKQNNYTSQYEQYSLGLVNNNVFLVITGVDRTQKLVQTSGNYTNQTVYVVGTCDTVTDEMKLYVNGTLIQTVAFTSTFDIANTPVTIGGTGTVGYAGWMNGKIHTAQIYNRALSATEVLQNYYQAPIVTDGLVLALDAGNLVSYESGSTTTYSMTGSFSGSLVNGTGYNSGNGGNWVFDGIDDYIQNPNRTLNTEFQYSDPFTIEVIAKIMENTNSGYLINNRALTDGNGTSYAGWGLLQFSGTIFGFIGGYPSTTFDWRNVNTSTTSFSSTVFEKWAHIVWTNGGTLNDGKIYLNGINATSQSYDNNTPPYTINYNGNQKITLGMSPADGTPGGHFLSGSIASVKIYNRALSAQEILQNFNAQKTRFGL